MPRVAVITAAKNAAAFIDDTLDSIQAQTFTDWSHVVVDDGSTDDTAARVATRADSDPRVRLVQLEHSRGPFAAANLALADVDAEYVARIDADDIALPERLQLQLDRLEGSDARACTGGWQVLGSDGSIGPVRRPPSHSNRVIKWQMWIRNRLPHSTLFIATDTMRDYGGYGPERVAEDFRLWSKLARDGRIAAIDEPVVLWRRSRGQITESAGARDQPERLRVRLDHISACDPTGGWTLDDARDFRYLGRTAPFPVGRATKLLAAWEAQWESHAQLTPSERAELAALSFELRSRHLRHAFRGQPIATALAGAATAPALLRQFVDRRR
ncbi:MAG: glycosyltransferase family 2 protein [Actinobacteria bacterium]|nr:glycosyltransferase family 2 protein [Actinomycetota bacterium]